MECEIFLQALESAKISQMMIFSYVVKDFCGYFVVTCRKLTADKQTNQQDFNTACAYDNIISSASATLFIPDTTSTFLGRKQYFTQIWKLLSIQHTAHFF